MIKNDLREQGFSVKDKITKKLVIIILWVLFTVLMMSGAIAFPVVKGVITHSPVTPVMNPASIPLYFLALIFFVYFYFALKFALTAWVCSDKYNGVQLKFLEENYLPVCHCREALTIWQTAFIYIIPVIITYTSLFLISVTLAGNPFDDVEVGFLTMLALLSFFMAFDVTLVAYVLVIKMRNKIDYISVDNHVYGMTLYNAPYVKRDGKILKNDMKAMESKYKKRMFTKVRTCLNRECENYALESDKSTKVCPSCGGDIYPSEVLTNVVTCNNKKCENYGQELKREMHVCSLCGEKTGKLAFNFNHRLIMPAIILVIISYIGFPFLFLYMDNYGVAGGALVSVIEALRYSILMASIVVSFLSKNKALIIISLISVSFSTSLIYMIMEGYFY